MGSNGGSSSVLFAIEGGNLTIYEGLSWDLWDHQLSFHPSMCHHGFSEVLSAISWICRSILCTLLEIIQIATESGFWFCWATLEQKTQGVWKSNPPHGEDCVGDWWYCTKVPPSRCRERKRLGSNFKLLQVQLFRVFFSHFLLSFDHLEASTQASFSCSSSCLHLLSESKLTSCFHFLSLELQQSELVCNQSA